MGDEWELWSVSHDDNFLMLMLKWWGLATATVCAATEQQGASLLHQFLELGMAVVPAECLWFHKKTSIAYKIPVLMNNHNDNEIIVHFILFIFTTLWTNEFTPVSISNARWHVWLFKKPREAQNILLRGKRCIGNRFWEEKLKGSDCVEVQSLFQH